MHSRKKRRSLKDKFSIEKIQNIYIDDVFRKVNHFGDMNAETFVANTLKNNTDNITKQLKRRIQEIKTTYQA